MLRKLLKIWNGCVSFSVIFLCRVQKISVDYSCRFYGFPFIYRCKASFISIGKKCNIRSSFLSNALGVNHRTIIRTLSPCSRIQIGSEVGMSGATIVARELISIGDRVLLGINVVITDSDHHPLDSRQRYLNDSADIKSSAINIMDDVWLGANVVVLKGVTIGARSVIGANSVVVSDVPCDVIAAGNPAKIIRSND